VKLQLANPALHQGIADFPFGTPLAEWDLSHMHGVLGLHRHVVRLIEIGDVSYVIKELPDDLVEREYRVLRELADEGLPTVEVVAALTGRDDAADGLLITRHLDYSLPYRTLLSGRGLTIPYLGERLLDALVSLLVRLHLAGFFWGDCSLSNTLFRRDAGELSAYVIDVETAERHPSLTDGQRRLDLQIAVENVAGSLLDLQTGGRLHADIDPWAVVQQIEDRYASLWAELTAPADFEPHERYRLQQRLQQLHDLGFDVEEMDIVDRVEGVDDGLHRRVLRYYPRVVEHGFHTQRLKNLTGLSTTENQARRLLDDIHAYRSELHEERRRQSHHGHDPPPLPENVAAVRWLDDRFEPIIARVPPQLFSKLEAAEIYHQLLEHRWHLAEKERRDVGLEEALDSYIDNVLAGAPDEVRHVEIDDQPDDPTRLR
jgi:hypothetical protein